jgi:hypothetical protein
MALMYEVTGYDRQTGRLAVSYDVPEQKIALVKKIAGIGSSDDGLGSYPLGATQFLKSPRLCKPRSSKADAITFWSLLRSPGSRLSTEEGSLCTLTSAAPRHHDRVVARGRLKIGHRDG